MYLKLNFNNGIFWKDVFNILRIILSNNINSITDLIYGVAITGVTGSSGSNQITLPSLTTNQLAQIVQGQSVTGPGIGTGAVITNISGSIVTLNVNNTASISGTTIFGGGTGTGIGSDAANQFKNNNIIANTETNKLDILTSEIVRTISPGVGYGSPSIGWTYNWAGSTNSPTYSGNYTAGPEMVFERNVSTYSPTSGSDTAGKYYIRLRYDNTSSTSTVQFLGSLYASTLGGVLTVASFTNGVGSINIGQAIVTGTAGSGNATITGSFIVVGTWGTSGNQWAVSGNTSINVSGIMNAVNSSENGFYVGTYKTASSWTSASTIGTASNSYVLTNGEDRLQGFGMSTITSFFLYITPTSFLVGGKGPTGSLTTQGWITSLPRTVSLTWPTSSTTSIVLANSYTLWGDGTKIRFDNPSSGTSQPNITVNLPYYIRNISTSSFAFNTSLLGVHTKTYVASAAGTYSNNILIDTLVPHNPVVSNSSSAQFGPAFVSEFKPYDPQALTWNGYIPVMYSGGVYQHTSTTCTRSHYGINSQDFLWAEPSITSQAYKVLGVVSSTPTLQNTWSQSYKVPVYIGTDLRTIERGPLGEQWYSSSYNIKTLGPALTDQPFYKFPDANLNPSFGLFPLVWSASQYYTAGGKLTPEIAGFMLFNGDYQPDDYFTYQGTTYSLWPLADGFLRRLGLAVPKA